MRSLALLPVALLACGVLAAQAGPAPVAGDRVQATSEVGRFAAEDPPGGDESSGDSRQQSDSQRSSPGPSPTGGDTDQTSPRGNDTGADSGAESGGQQRSSGGSTDSAGTAAGQRERQDGPSPLQITEDGRHFVRDGEAFWWMGDTGWAMFSQASEEDALRYLEMRDEQGFNVIQAVAIFPHVGEKPVDGDVSQAPQAEQYWDKMDRLIAEAAARDMYVAVLPVWGDQQAGSVVTTDNAAEYGAFLGERFGGHSNIVWMMGGDHPADGQEEIWANLAQGLEEAGANQLKTYHPRGDQSSAQWFADADWLDFHTIQGGHCLRYDSRSEVIEQTYDSEPAKPFLDGEPIYEEHPYCWEPDQGFSTALDVRRDAYWAAMSGAAGHTYGHHSVWQFLEGGEGLMGARGSWTEAMRYPGAIQMGHLRALMESRPFWLGVPDASALTSDPGSGESQTKALVARDGSWLMAYTGAGQPVGVDLGKLDAERVVAHWFDPRTGEAQETEISQEAVQPPDEGDWVLVVDDADADYPVSGATSSNSGGADRRDAGEGGATQSSDSRRTPRQSDSGQSGSQRESGEPGGRSEGSSSNNDQTSSGGDGVAAGSGSAGSGSGRSQGAAGDATDGDGDGTRSPGNGGGRSEVSRRDTAGSDTRSTASRESTASRQQRWRVMPLGASITEGVGSSDGGGYRTELLGLLRDAGMDVDFVGSAAAGPEDLSDRDHEGHSGWCIGSPCYEGRTDTVLRREVERWLADTQPHVILLHAGTNDLLAGVGGTEAGERLEGLVEQVTETLPKTRLVIAEIAGSHQSRDDDAAVAELNSAARRIADTYTEHGYRVQTVDTATVLGEGDYADAVHPNDEGYTKLARVWADALLG